jgi:hypothetical protein
VGVAVVAVVVVHVHHVHEQEDEIVRKKNTELITKECWLPNHQL